MAELCDELTTMSRPRSEETVLRVLSLIQQAADEYFFRAMAEKNARL